MPTSARQTLAAIAQNTGNSVTSQRADVGIGPYREAAGFMRYRATKPTFL